MTAKNWRSTCETRFATKHLTLFRGGPAAACRPEHSHAEAQISVRFGPLGNANGSDPVQVSLYAPHQSHWLGWGEGWDVIVWHLSGGLLEQAADELGARGRFEVIPVNCGRDGLLEAMARMFLQEFPAGADRGSLYIESMAAFLAGYILRRHCDARVREFSTRRLTAIAMRRLHGLLRERMEAGFDVVALARWMGMPQQEFAERLRLTTGLAPWAYVQRYRISMACRLLKDERLSLAEVAHRLGFASQSHFTNAFRTKMRITPGAYRRSV